MQAVSHHSFIIKFLRNSSWSKRFVALYFISLISGFVQHFHLRQNIWCIPCKEAFQYGNSLEFPHDKRIKKDLVQSSFHCSDCSALSLSSLSFHSFCAFVVYQIFIFSGKYPTPAVSGKKINKKCCFAILLYDIFTFDLPKFRILSISLLRSQLHNSLAVLFMLILQNA